MRGQLRYQSATDSNEYKLTSDKSCKRTHDGPFGAIGASGLAIGVLKYLVSTPESLDNLHGGKRRS